MVICTGITATPSLKWSFLVHHPDVTRAIRGVTVLLVQIRNSVLHLSSFSKLDFALKCYLSQLGDHFAVLHDLITYNLEGITIFSMLLNWTATSVSLKWPLSKILFQTQPISRSQGWKVRIRLPMNSKCCIIFIFVFIQDWYFKVQNIGHFRYFSIFTVLS